MTNQEKYGRCPMCKSKCENKGIIKIGNDKREIFKCVKCSYSIGAPVK